MSGLSLLTFDTGYNTFKINMMRKKDNTIDDNNLILIKK